ncbi:MAG: hypothetical protein MN733_35675 [Nitrososphaera sp.]|nr:hypothetical protein [Nitrososphaera sp.]
MTIIVASLGEVNTLTRYMLRRLAYWTTLRMIRTKAWKERAPLKLMAADILYCLLPPKDGALRPPAAALWIRVGNGSKLKPLRFEAALHRRGPSRATR